MADVGLDDGRMASAARPGTGAVNSNSSNSSAVNRPSAGGGPINLHSLISEGDSIDDLLGTPSSAPGAAARNPRSIVRDDQPQPSRFGGGSGGPTPLSQNNFTNTSASAGSSMTVSSPAAGAANLQQSSSFQPGASSSAAAAAASGLNNTAASSPTGKKPSLNPFDHPVPVTAGGAAIAAGAEGSGRLQPLMAADLALDGNGTPPIGPTSPRQAPGGERTTPAAASTGEGRRLSSSTGAAKPLDQLFNADDQVIEFHENLRHPAIAFFIIAFSSFAFSFAQVATTAYTHAHGGNTFDLTLWTATYCIADATTSIPTCATSTLPFSTWCGALDSRWRAMQAFSVLIVLYSAVMLVLGYAALDVERARPFTWDLVSKSVYPVRLVQFAGFGFWLFLLIQWALVASTFHVTPCETSVASDQANRLLGVRTLMRSGFRLSSSWALTFVMWWYWSALLVWIWYKKRTVRPDSLAMSAEKLDSPKQQQRQSAASPRQQQRMIADQGIAL